MNPDTSTVVALVGPAIDDVQVVVDSLGIRGVEVTGPLGVAKIREVDDVSDRAAGSS